MQNACLRLCLLSCLPVVGLAACGHDASSPDAAMDAATDTATPDASMPGVEPDAGADAALVPDASVDAASDVTSSDTWTTFAEDFFAAYCVGCHFGAPRDYRTMTEVQRDQSTIACGVGLEARDGCGSFPAPGMFPVGTGPKPSEAERARLVAWIDSGLP